MVAWAYNEELLIGDFLARAVALLSSTVEDFEVVLVDDGSTDGTARIAQEAASSEPRIRVVTHPRNLGVGQAARTAFAAAKKETLFWQTVDWSYDISELRILLELQRHYDVIWGVRPCPERLLSHVPVVRSIYRVRTRSDNLFKAVVSLSNYYLLRILFGMPFQDFQNVGILKTEVLQSLGLHGKSSFLSPEILMRYWKRDARFIEVPIPFIRRSKGDGKGTRLSAIIASVRDILVNWLRHGWRFRWENLGNKERRIWRVSEPFFLDEEVARLVVPLFKYYVSHEVNNEGGSAEKAPPSGELSTLDALPTNSDKS